MDDTHWILKSLTREFETRFFFATFLPAYIPYAQSHPSSLLIRCSDTLYNFEVYLGHLGGLSSGNYMVMEDLISRARALSEDVEEVRDWDLKPGGYMHPEKDTIGLGSDEEKEEEEEGIEDGTVWLKEEDWKWVKETLERDTQFLADLGIVDYSLLLTRSPLPPTYSPSSSEEKDNERGRPTLISPDNKYIYHLAIIDYMISKHTWFPQLMENIAHPLNKKIQEWGRCEGKKWRYTMTEEPGAYREEFLGMVSKAVRTDAKVEE
ncbi:SAICAR synthase-like protein, partial [Saitoella complicata NRRL Y-17804]